MAGMGYVEGYAQDSEMGGVVIRPSPDKSLLAKDDHSATVLLRSLPSEVGTEISICK
jgi:hypothetical protein